MHRTVGVILVGLVALAGCKKKMASGDDAAAIAKMVEFADAMCACKDKACADAVQDRMTTWATEAAERIVRNTRPSEANMQRMTEIGTRYGECMTRLMTPPVPPEPVKPPRITLSVPAQKPSIAKLIAEAKEYHRAPEEELAIHVLRARYVGSDGELDPTHGELTLGFGNRLPPPPGSVVDDPKRKTGAPVPPPAPAAEPKRPELASCPEGEWTMRSGWTWGGRLCMAALELTPRCSIEEVWKRAVKAKKAPTDALATIELVRTDADTQLWEFSIYDELRKVNIAAQIPDTCDPIAEKP